MEVNTMNDRVTKNYFKDGGDTLVIGGKLVVEEGAEVEGLDTGGGSEDLPVATKRDLGVVRVGTGLDVSASGTVSVGQATTVLCGGVKMIPYQANTSAASLTDLETEFNALLTALRAAGIMEKS
jgi:hypothetical protein